jgi:hypothetical protein
VKRLALILTCAAAGVLGFAAHVLLATWRFYNSAGYAPGTHTSYQAGGVEADGSGLYAPGLLLFGLGLFLLKWAHNLWRGK